MGEVKRYHADLPDWRKTTSAKKGQLIGIELEVNHKKGKHLAADALDSFEPGKHPAPLTENDSSLDTEQGVEIICPPLPLAEVVDDEGYIHRLMKNQAEAGTDKDPTVNYGMHININMDGWGPEEKLLVQYLCNRFYTTGTTLGRRTQGFGRYTPTFKLVRMPGGSVSISTWPGDKHAAAHIRQATMQSLPGGVDGTVIEVRLAKSTLDIEDLRVMIDYIFALKNWVAIAPRHTLACCFLDRLSGDGIRTISPLEKMFKYWCRKNAPTVYAAMEGRVAEEIQAKPNRLTVMQKLISDNLTELNFRNTGIHYDKSTGCKEQAVRLSTAVSKGLKLQGEFAYNGLLFATTVRPAN